MSILDEVRGNYKYKPELYVGEPISGEKAKSLGLSVQNPLQDDLEAKYEHFVTTNPDAQARRVWNAKKVGVPLWVQERADIYQKEADTRLALLDNGMPDFYGLTVKAPVTARFMTQNDAMSTSHDDIENLQAAEEAANRLSFTKLNVSFVKSRNRAQRLMSLAELNNLRMQSIPHIKGQEIEKFFNTPVSGTLKPVISGVDSYLSNTSFGEGMKAGAEMSNIAGEAVALYNDEALGRPNDESKWVGLEKRLYSLDNNAPEGWFRGMLYETGKFLGQQAAGSMTTGSMASAGGLMGMYGSALGGALPSAASFGLGAGGIMGGGLLAAGVALPPLAGAAAITAAAGWSIGKLMGMYMQSAKVEGGLDLISRRMLTDGNGDHLSSLAIGLGSMGVGALNGALELAEWNIAGRPITGAVKRVIPAAVLDRVTSRTAERIVKLPAIVRIGGMAVKDWAMNDIAESFTEVAQDLVPIITDEFQKESLLDGYDRKTVGEINAQLSNTFAQSMYSFALISAAGPAGSIANKNYRMELMRKEIEGAETKLLNSRLNDFAGRVMATKLWGRIPGMSREHTDAILESADTSHIYMPAQKIVELHQSGLIDSEHEYDDAAAWAKDKLGIDEANFKESLEKETPVEITAADMMSGLYDNEKEMEALGKEISYTPDGMTLSEVAANESRIKELQQKDVFRLKTDIEQEAAEQTSAYNLYKQKSIELAAGGLDEETAKANAWMTSRIYINLARMLTSASPLGKGKRYSPEDAAKIMPLLISRDSNGSVSGLTFDQDAARQSGEAASETYYQPINEDVNTDSSVHVVDLSNSYDGTSYSNIQEIKNKIRDMVPLKITTADNKMLVEVLNRNASHLAHSSAPIDVSLNIPALRKAAFDNLSDIIAGAVLIESINNEKIKEIDPSWSKSKKRSVNRKNSISYYHRLYVPITVNGMDYKTIRLVAEEHADGSISVDPKAVELYDVIPEDKSARLSTAPANNSGKLIDLPGISQITIREMLNNVNDFYGKSYLQSARGSITLPTSAGQPAHITLGKDADRSTFVHELAHFYLAQLRTLSAGPSVINTANYTGPKSRWNQDLQIISDWWNADAERICDWITKNEASEDVKKQATADAYRKWLADGMETQSAVGQAFDRAGHEYFARGFEAYLREGVAPAKELTGLFRKFKAWLCEIYKSLTALDVELSDDIRQVFDRMVATDDAIEQLRAEHEVDRLLENRESYTMTEDEALNRLPFEDDPYEAAKEFMLGETLKELSSERRAEMAARAEEVRPDVIGQIMAEKSWQVFYALTQNPDMRLLEEEILNRYGEEVLSKLSEDIVSADGMSLDMAARNFDYDSPDELIGALAGKSSVKEETDRRVRAVLEAEMGSAVNDPEKMDRAADEAWATTETSVNDAVAESLITEQDVIDNVTEDDFDYHEKVPDAPSYEPLIDKAKERADAVIAANKKKRADYVRKLDEWKAARKKAFAEWQAGLKEKARGKAGDIVENARGKAESIAQGAREKAGDIVQDARDKVALNRSKVRLKNALIKDNNSQLYKNRKNARVACDNILAARKISSLFDVTVWVKAAKEYRLNADKALRRQNDIMYRHCREREAYYLELIRASYRAIAEAEYIRTKLKKYGARKSKQTMGMDTPYLYQLDALLSRFETERLTRKDAKDMTAEELAALEEAKPLAEFIKEQGEYGVAILIPDWILNSNEKIPYYQLMLHQLRGVFESAKNIIKTGRDASRTIASERNAKIDDIEQEVFSASKEFYGDKVVGRMYITVEADESSFIGTALDDLKTPEAICRAIDGYKDGGPMQRYVFRPIREAQTRESLELARIFGEFRALKDRVYGVSHTESAKEFSIGVVKYERISDPENPGKYKHIPTKRQSLFTRENLICAALNMGNVDNIQRLMDGWGWTPGDIETIKAQLTDQDWEYVQGCWDLLETMWPQIKKVHELMTGQTINKVEAKSFKTLSGKELRGGYYPIVTDLRYSIQAAGQSEQKEIRASSPMQYANKYTESGHTKARAEYVIGRPPLLEFGVMDNHIANVIHDYEMSGALRDVRMIMKRDLVRQTIKESVGDRCLTDITKWLNDVAANTKNNGIVMGTVDRGASCFKNSTAIFALGGNIGGALMQSLGYFALAHRIGFVQTALAIMNGLDPRTNIYKFVRNKSAFMREQMDNGQTKEIRMLRKNWTSGKHGISGAGDFMLSIYPLMQNLCNVPGWAQCYRIGMNKYGGNEKEAIAYADSVIRQTQSASLLSDLTTMERSGIAGQLITMFYSWFRVMYNMQNEALNKVRYEHGVGRFKDLASYVFYVLVGQSLAEALLRGNGPDPDDDDPYKWAKWTAARLFYAPFSTIPLVRELGSSMENQFKFGIKLTPAQEPLDAVMRLLKVVKKNGENIAEGEDVDYGEVAEAVAIVVGHKYGLPNRAMIKAAKAFLEAYDEDKAIPWLYLTLGGGYKPKED